jgi:hypothetical protein
MPKYYVQSGSVQLVTTAANSSSAAIWAIHRALSSTFPFLRETEAPAEAEGGSQSPGPAVLGETLNVSERGFDRADAQTFETLEVVTEWNQLLLAIDKLQKRLAEIG